MCNTILHCFASNDQPTALHAAQSRTNPPLLGWPTTADGRRYDPFSAAQQRATQRKLIRVPLQRPLHSVKRHSTCPSEMSQNSPVNRLQIQLLSLKTHLIQLAGNVQPNLPHLYETMNFLYNLFMQKTYKQTRGKSNCNMPKYLTWH